MMDDTEAQAVDEELAWGPGADKRTHWTWLWTVWHTTVIAPATWVAGLFYQPTDPSYETIE